MCYTAIPGQTGIRADFFESAPRPERVIYFMKSAIPSASVTPAYAVAPRMVSMSHDVIAGRGESRRYRRYDDLRGKRLAKRLHKPDWRNYEKY